MNGTKERILYLECNSGISGDMTVGALLDLGADKDRLVQALDSMKVDGYHLHFGRKAKCGIDAFDLTSIWRKKIMTTTITAMRKAMIIITTTMRKAVIIITTATKRIMIMTITTAMRKTMITTTATKTAITIIMPTGDLERSQRSLTGWKKKIP